MENNQKEIIDIALDRLNQEGLWFTTKEDKLYANAKDLYKLDKFGELEDKSKERLIAEVESYLGDGATFIIEAVDQWIEDNLAEGLLGYVDTLAMDFEIPEAVENTNSYSEQGVDNLETTVAKEADKAKKEEGKKIVEDNDKDFDAFQRYIMDNIYCDNETMMTSPEIIESNINSISKGAAKEVVEDVLGETEYTGLYHSMLKDYTDEIKRIILANIDRIVYLQNIEQEELNAKLTEGKDDYSKPVKVDDKWFRYNYKYNELEYITHASNEFGPIEVIDSIGVDPEDWKEDKDLCIQRFLEDIKSEEDVDISEFNSLFPKKLKEISSKVNCMHYAYNEPNVYRYMFANKKDAEEAKSILGQYGKVEEVDPMEFSEYEDKKDLDKVKVCLVVTFNSDVLTESKKEEDAGSNDNTLSMDVIKFLKNTAYKNKPVAILDYEGIEDAYENEYIIRMKIYIEEEDGNYKLVIKGSYTNNNGTPFAWSNGGWEDKSGYVREFAINKSDVEQLCQAIIARDEDELYDFLGAYDNNFKDDFTSYLAKGYDRYRDEGKKDKSVNFNESLNTESNGKSLTEGARRRLNERNEQSASIIDKALQGISEDTSDKESGIIIKTSELFKKLSDRGYDVQVSFDNGESTSSIAIGQQGANVLITITDADQPLRAFISGNLEVNDDSLKMIKSIMEVIK